MPVFKDLTSFISPLALGCIILSAVCMPVSAEQAGAAPVDLASRPVSAKALPYIRQGYAEIAKKSYDRAIKSLRKAIAEDKDCISARRYLAYALIQKGQAKEALSVMQTVSKMVPANAFDFYLFGAAYYAAGGTAEAKDCYLEALRQNPRYDAARAGLVTSLTKQHNYEEALNAVQQGLQLTSNEATRRYYTSLSKAVMEAQAYQEQQSTSGGVNSGPAAVSTQVGGDAVKSAPVIIK
ncbi:MAG: tetratricopeptide repeat protein [Cyanobacteria bacterium SZAS TMP-1]|nr:tetratricopeptide repeat protein [Cyanobacteria bacterium SZAS TMP-1]